MGGGEAACSEVVRSATWSQKRVSVVGMVMGVQLKGRAWSWDGRRRSCMQRGSAQCHLVAKACVRRGHGYGRATIGIGAVVGREGAKMHVAGSTAVHLCRKSVFRPWAVFGAGAWYHPGDGQESTEGAD